MNQEKREPLGPNRFRLPVAMAKYATAVGWVHLDSLGNRLEPEGWARKVVGNDGLQMAVGEAAARLKRMQARGKANEPTA
jgi:hypothetical protein